MRIVLIQKDKIIRVYHDPKEVIVHPKTKIVEILNLDGTVNEKFELIKNELSWEENKKDDTVEIVLSLTVGKFIVN